MSVSLTPGSLIQFFYPRHNFIGVRRETQELRRLLVTAVRDTRDEPLESATFVYEPNLRRGRLIVTGYDLDKHAERSFYVESMSELRELDRKRKLPPLRTVIIREGQIAGEESQPDPRAGFAEHFNSCGQHVGLQAVA